MRILTVADFMIPQVVGGSSVVVHEVMRRLKARGHDITLLTRRAPDTPAAVDGMPVLSYAPVQSETLYPLSVVRCLRCLGSALRRGDFDLINSHHAYSGLGVELRRRWGTPIPSVYHFHGSWEAEAVAKEGGGNVDRSRPATHRKYRARRAMERYVLRSCTAIVGLSEYSRGEVEAIAPEAVSKFHKIAGGVDTQRFRYTEDRASQRRRLGLPVDGPVVLTVRRLVHRMGLENLLRAMHQVQAAQPGVTLIIGGKGPLQELLSRQIAELELRKTRLIGYVADEDLPLYYQAADLFIMPSTAVEGFGLTTLEAFACGTPVLATPVGANPEVLGEVLPDFVLKDVEPETLAAGILRKLPQTQEPALRRRLREHAERHSWDAITGQTEALFQEIARC